MKEVSFRYSSSCCDKILRQTQLNRGRAHVGSQMSQSIMVGKSEQQHEAAAHATFSVKKQRDERWCATHLLQDLSHGRDAAHS